MENLNWKKWLLHKKCITNADCMATPTIFIISLDLTISINARFQRHIISSLKINIQLSTLFILPRPIDKTGELRDKDQNHDWHPRAKIWSQAASRSRPGLEDYKSYTVIVVAIINKGFHMIKSHYCELLMECSLLFPRSPRLS